MLLAVVRHAKAEKQAATGRDEDRALTERGERQAAFLGERFGLHTPRPDMLIASPAQRTRQTAARIARGCGLDFDFDPRLFIGQPASGAMDLVRERATVRAAEFLVLVGHNDQVSELVNWLSSVPPGRPERAGPEELELRTGQAVLLSPRRTASGDFGPGCWRILDSWRLEGA